MDTPESSYQEPKKVTFTLKVQRRMRVAGPRRRMKRLRDFGHLPHDQLVRDDVRIVPGTHVMPKESKSTLDI